MRFSIQLYRCMVGGRAIRSIFTSSFRANYSSRMLRHQSCALSTNYDTNSGSSSKIFLHGQRGALFSPSCWGVAALHTSMRALMAAPPIDIKTPAVFTESISEGEFIALKKVGDAVEEDEEIGQIESEKSNFSVRAPTSGTITELLVENGTVVGVSQLVMRMDTSSAPAAAAPVEQPIKPAEPSLPSPASPSPPPPSPSTEAPPIANQVLREVRPPANMADLHVVTQQSPPPAHSAQSAKAGGAEPSGITGLRQERSLPMSSLRRRIAERLKDAQNTCAMLTTFNEVDMTNLLELRNRYKDVFAKRHGGVKLGIMSTFISAAVHALRDQPIVNAVIDEEGRSIIHRDYIDVSVAVSTPRGLFVPVLRNADQMNYADIEVGLADLSDRAMHNRLAVEEMAGGTFTVSNGGVFKSLFSTPIINRPQSAILGMHGTFERPVVLPNSGGKIEARPMMYIALTYDHRLIDGRESVTFLRKIKEFVEDPRVAFLGL